MTWTYTNNPANSNRDLVRDLINDTNTSDQKVSDEFIAYALSAKPNVYLSAALCAERIAGTKVDNVTRKKVGDLELSYEQQSASYRMLAKSLRVQAMTAAKPYSGGIGVSDKATQKSDSDWARPAFERGMHDYDRASTSTGF